MSAMRSVLAIFAVLAAFAANAEPSPLSANVPGFVAVTIKPGTNTVSNLPFTANMRPFLKSCYVAKPGDTFVWKGETHVFDGKTWSGPNGGNALVPTHESFVIIRTAQATDVWNVGGEIDMNKAPKK